jgi:hypothetical protein
MNLSGHFVSSAVTAWPKKKKLFKGKAGWAPESFWTQVL